MDPTEKLLSALNAALNSGSVRKISFSRYTDKSILRASAHLFDKKGETFLQIERFTSDGKAYHENFPISSAADAVINEFEKCSQLNIMTSADTLEAKKSSKGKLLVSGKVSAAASVPVPAHDRNKQHILYEGNSYDFLIALGVTDRDGKVFDKKRSKFRQIDRFLHYINDIYPKLQKDGELYVLDLCCGKSYLTFAAYWYLTAVKGRKVSMVGADLKEDVIEFCSKTASDLKYDGLKFICCDISKFTPDRKPSLVLSLHACDIATDIVLTTAARLQSDVILSTPCCHHQVMDQLSDSSPVGSQIIPLLKHSLLKQKLAVALTDALRCKRLEAAGYSVDVTELIDPEDTPKNLLIRAVRTSMTDSEKLKHQKEFEALSLAFGVDIHGGI